MMEKPVPGQLYRSNNGAGPVMARVLSADDAAVTLERWNGQWDERDSRVRTQFTIPMSFFLGKTCGWVPYQPPRS
jgi:hypothetical protein